MPIPETREYLNPAEVNEIYGLTEEYQSTMRVQKRIPYIKVGGSVKYSKAKLDAWILEGEVEVQK